MDFSDFTLFDVFMKQNILYANLSINSIPIEINSLYFKLGNQKFIEYDRMTRNTYEPMLLVKFKQETNGLCLQKVNKLNGYYKEKKCELPFVEIASSKEKKDIAITTLFKDDYALFPIFYNYYMKQGISHFYMYYNGILNDDIRDVFKLPNVTLIEWNFRYWNPNSFKFRHHAQCGQMGNALHKYGKDKHEYMIFCDLDEYMYVKGKTLKEFIFETNKDCYMFLNKWSKTIDGKIPDKFPNKFIAAKNSYPNNRRSKCIYKTKKINSLYIHFPPKHLNLNFFICNEGALFHFLQWSNPNRSSQNPEHNKGNWIPELIWEQISLNL